MHVDQRITIWITRLGLMMVVSMNADADIFGFGRINWQEEVLLHDGSKIIVERSVEHGGRHELGQESPFKWQRLRFTMPATKEIITWEDNYSEDVGSANFLPMLLDVQQGVVYLVADTMGCLSYNKWGRSNPPYIVFKYINKDWKRIPLQELPVEIKTPNLIFSSPDDEVAKIGKSFISTEMIQKIMASHRQPEYRTILRAPIATGEVSCPELVRIKGGWGSPGGIKRMIPYTQ